MYHSLFAHGTHVHNMESMEGLDHCLPILVGAGVIIIILLAVIIYLLASDRRSHVKPEESRKTKSK